VEGEKEDGRGVRERRDRRENPRKRRLTRGGKTTAIVQRIPQIRRLTN